MNVNLSFGFQLSWIGESETVCSTCRSDILKTCSLLTGHCVRLLMILESSPSLNKAIRKCVLNLNHMWLSDQHFIRYLSDSSAAQKHYIYATQKLNEFKHLLKFNSEEESILEDLKVELCQN